MKEISDKLRARFCKDNNLQVGIFKEPYFTERLLLIDKLYPDKYIWRSWESFKKLVQETYGSEQEYFEDYNRIKDEAIKSIKESNGFNRFNSIDMNQFRCKNMYFSSGNIFHEINDRRIFLSIDMIKANFTSLSIFDQEIFKGMPTWEDFIQSFTDYNHIIHSKYIRQVILGNCNPKRHITYEKYLMDRLLTVFLESDTFNQLRVVSFSNDEIIFDITDSYIDTDMIELIDKMLQTTADIMSNGTKSYVWRHKMFKLFKIGDVGYVEKDLRSNHIELKCVNQFVLPFIVRKILDEPYEESDYIFMHDSKLLSKFIEEPKIELPGELINSGN